MDYYNVIDDMIPGFDPLPQRKVEEILRQLAEKIMELEERVKELEKENKF